MLEQSFNLLEEFKVGDIVAMIGHFGRYVIQSIDVNSEKGAFASLYDIETHRRVASDIPLLVLGSDWIKVGNLYEDDDKDE